MAFADKNYKEQLNKWLIKHKLEQVYNELLAIGVDSLHFLKYLKEEDLGIFFEV